MKKINAFLLLVLAMMMWNYSSAQVTIFTETMGGGGSNGASIATWENNNYFDNDSFTMSGTGDIRNTSFSSTANYTEASGTWNVMLNSLNEFFLISGVNTSTYSQLTLSFGIRKGTNAENGAGMLIQVSENGNDWTDLVMPALPTGQSGWYYRTCTGDIPSVSNLRIRFTSTSTTEFRIDDIKLTGTLSASPTLSVSSLTDFATQCTGGTYGPNSFRVTGSNLTGDVSVGALAGFTYSLTSGGTYTSTLSLIPSSGSLDQEVFVKFSPALAQSYNGDIVVSGGGASSVNRSVTGAGTAAVSAVVSSTAANSIGNTTATLNANLSTLGTCPSTTEKGFVYSLTSANASPTVGGSGVTKVEVAGISTGTYSHALSSLSGNSGYSFRAYVYNGSTYTYGDVLTFSTTSPATKLAFGTSPPANG